MLETFVKGEMTMFLLERKIKPLIEKDIHTNTDRFVVIIIERVYREY